MNCVSNTTFPHFIRFVFYAVIAETYLQYFIFSRGAVLWNNRNLPSYLGPEAWQMGHLFSILLVNSITLLSLFILLVRSLWNLGANTTTIEGWEIERHIHLLRRSRSFGGYLDGPDGAKVRIVRQEFPYDIGIFRNIAQGMGSSNVSIVFEARCVGHFLIDSAPLMVLAALCNPFARERASFRSERY